MLENAGRHASSLRALALTPISSDYEFWARESNSTGARLRSRGRSFPTLDFFSSSPFPLWVFSLWKSSPASMTRGFLALKDFWDRKGWAIRYRLSTLCRILALRCSDKLRVLGGRRATSILAGRAFVFHFRVSEILCFWTVFSGCLASNVPRPGLYIRCFETGLR